MVTEDRLIDIREVMKRTALGRSTVYKAVAGECPGLAALPQPIKLGRKSVWSAGEVSEWIAERKAQRAPSVSKTVARNQDPQTARDSK